MSIPTQAAGDPPVAIIPRTPAEVAKAIVYTVFAVVAVLAAALADDEVSPIELVNAGIALVGAVPVYWLAGTLAKTLAAFALAFLQALVTTLATVTGFADVSLGTWLGIVVSAGAAVGVVLIPNAPPPTPAPLLRDGVTYNITTLPEGPAAEEVARILREHS